MTAIITIMRGRRTGRPPLWPRRGVLAAEFTVRPPAGYLGRPGFIEAGLRAFAALKVCVTEA
jgi:hypothetical protein